MKILIAPNSFKECASATIVADLLAENLQKEISKKSSRNIELIKRPVTDGGDGFLDVIFSVLNTTSVQVEISTPWLKGKLRTSIAYSESKRQVFVESAKVLGLNLIPEKKRNPLLLSSVGIGEILNFLTDAFDKGKLNFDEVIIGVGGTGTNDLALGALEQLGLELLDGNGKVTKAVPENFLQTESLKIHLRKLPFKLKFVVDVENPLLGEHGATAVYGAQKGIAPKDLPKFEKGFERIIALAQAENFNIKNLSGAGGGLAAGFQIFYNAEIIHSEDFIKNFLGINSLTLKPDVVITGEGKFDEQTLMKKAPGVLLNEFKNAKRIVICGVSDFKNTSLPFQVYELIKYFNSIEDSIKNFNEGIKLACEEIVKEFYRG